MDDPPKYPERDEHPYSEYFDFGFSRFGTPDIDQDNGILVIPVQEFKVYPHFPGYDQTIIVLDGDLIFEGVTLSIREIAKNWNEKEQTYTLREKIIHETFPTPNGVPYQFYLGGFTIGFKGWVEWYVDAVTVKIHERKSLPSNTP